MSDEAGFLAQLDANPDDDTTRLVYADWLDERGDARAVFLRLDLQLATAGSDTDAEAALKALREPLDPEWVARVGKRYDLALLGYAADAKIQTIKVLRELTGVGLYVAKVVSEALPNCPGVALLRHEAERWRDAFTNYIAHRVRVAVVRSDYSRPIYSLVGTGYLRDYDPFAVERLAQLRQIPYEEALRCCDHSPMVLLDNLRLREALAHSDWLTDGRVPVVVRRMDLERAVILSAGTAGPAHAS